MNTFVDCPCCGSEFIIDENILSSNLRCPDCLQWVNHYSQEDSGRSFVPSYAAGYNHYYDDYGYEAGYDY
jgi:hypothetical protein